MPIYTIDLVFTRDDVLVVRGLVARHGQLPVHPDPGFVNTRRAKIKQINVVSEHAKYLRHLVRRAMRRFHNPHGHSMQHLDGGSSMGFSLDLRQNRGCPPDPDTCTLVVPPSGLSAPRHVLLTSLSYR